MPVPTPPLCTQEHTRRCSFPLQLRWRSSTPLLFLPLLPVKTGALCQVHTPPSTYRSSKVIAQYWWPPSSLEGNLGPDLSRYLLLFFAMDNTLPCIMRTHVVGPNIWEKNLLFSFLNSIIYLFMFRNKTDNRIPGYYFAYGYHHCFVETHFN